MTGETDPLPLDPPRRASFRRVVLRAAATAAALGAVGGTVAWATTRQQAAPEIAPEAVLAAHDDPHGDVPAGSDAASGAHRHDPLPPYPERYAAASAQHQQAADDLVADVRTSIAGYADVDAASAAGYLPPRRPRGALVHYLDPSPDPGQPPGLVYYRAGADEPLLLGAFFVTPAGTPASPPAGDLVVWHSHDPACPGFFATTESPCLDARRMLHVWTVDQPLTVRVVDPFGVPFRASVERVDA